MLGVARFRILLLALMVAVSHVALLSHAAAHFQPDLEQCELCVGQPQPLAGIPVAESGQDAAAIAISLLPGSHERLAPAEPLPAFRQRAPPSISS